METILLIVIIGYVLFRASRFLLKYRNLYKLLGYKRIFIAGNPIILRKLEPKDFAEEPSGVPLTLFQYRKGVSIVDNLRPNDKDDDNILEAVALAKKMAEKAIVYMGGTLKTESVTGIEGVERAVKIGGKFLRIDDLFNCHDVEAVKLGWQLYGMILDMNFKTLYKTYQLDRMYVIHVAELCVAFGKKPHEHLGNPKMMTPLEKYILDDFVFNTYILNENDKARRQAEAYK